MPALTDVSVIVPTRNERRNVLAFLRTLPQMLTLIMVDSSDDDTPQLVAAARPENTIIVQQACSISAARQIGAELARTPWLVFTDADISFAPDYFARLQHEANAEAMYGAKLSMHGYAQYYAWTAWAQGWSHRLGAPAASGSNLVIRRDALMRIGGFDQSLTCNEDSEVVWRLKRYGFRVTFVPDLVVYARDHRRLQRGILRKTYHTAARCTLLYFNLIPARWRSRDWGYWTTQSRPVGADTPIT